MEYIEDSSLTPQQQELKWYIYCEANFETDENIKAVLQSLLKDLEGI